jgi:hypothetical protein
VSVSKERNVVLPLDPVLRAAPNDVDALDPQGEPVPVFAIGRLPELSTCRESVESKFVPGTTKLQLGESFTQVNVAIPSAPWTVS